MEIKTAIGGGDGYTKESDRNFLSANDSKTMLFLDETDLMSINNND